MFGPCDAVETQQPAGCRTPVMRKLWSRGQQAPTDAYAAWRAHQPDGGPEPLDETPVAAEGEAREFPLLG